MSNRDPIILIHVLGLCNQISCESDKKKLYYISIFLNMFKIIKNIFTNNEMVKAIAEMFQENQQFQEIFLNFF